MSKNSSLAKQLNRKVTAVWFIQNNKRFLMNWFNSFETAKSYCDAFSHYKINGELLMGEVSLKYLVEEGGLSNA